MTTRQTRRRRPVSAQGMNRLESWAGRKPCIALMGEFSAGKTTLTNFLLGEDVLPTRVTATQLPPVWMSYGEPQAWYVDTEGRRHDVDFENLYDVPVEGVRYIRLFCKGRILETIDLIDTPGISDPNIPKTVWEMAVGYVNAVLWCTHSTQAWRESERSAWDSLPERLRENSVLLATRSDKLRPVERERVARRLRREAAGMFRDIVMFSAMDAIRAASEDETGDLWSESGGEALLTALQAIAHDIIEARKGMLSRYTVIENKDAAPARVQPGRTVRPGRADQSGAGSRARLSQNDADEMRSQILEDADESAATAAQPSAEVLHLTFAQRIAGADPALEEDAPTVEDEAEAAADLGDDSVQHRPAAGAPDANSDPAALSELVARVSAPEAEPDWEPETDVAAAAADTAAADEDGVLPGGAVELWRAVLASGPAPRSVAQVLDLMERFLSEVDRRDAEAMAAAEAEAEEADRRKHG